jgi:predicted transcriptional regulator
MIYRKVFIKLINKTIIMTDISKTTINLPSDLKKELKKMAIDEDTSLSGLIIKMIEEGYEARTKEDSVE